MTHEEAYEQWKNFLFLNEINSFDQLNLTQKEFLKSLSQKYNGKWEAEILLKVKEEFLEFYEGEQTFGIKIQALDLDGLDTKNWQMLFEDESEDPLVHVYFNNWNIDFLAMTG